MTSLHVLQIYHGSVDTDNRILCKCPVLGINNINQFLATFFIFWKKKRWLFLTRCINTCEICHKTFINHGGIIYKMIHQRIRDLDILCLQTCSTRNLIIIVFCRLHNQLKFSFVNISQIYLSTTIFSLHNVFIKIFLNTCLFTFIFYFAQDSIFIQDNKYTFKRVHCENYYA